MATLTEQLQPVRPNQGRIPLEVVFEVPDDAGRSCCFNNFIQNVILYNRRRNRKQTL
jgi:hypothetical protein